MYLYIHIYCVIISSKGVKKISEIFNFLNSIYEVEMK